MKVAFLNSITLGIRKVEPVVVSARYRVRKTTDRNGIDPRSAGYVSAKMAEILR